MIEEKTFGKNPLTLHKYFNWTVWKPCNTKSFSLNNNSNTAPAKLAIGAVAAVRFLGISHRLSELCCTLEILSYLKNYANGKGQYKSLKPAFQCPCGEEEWEESSPMCTHSLWCRLAKLHSRCCSDLYLWIKNVRIRVVKAVGFLSRDLRWYSCVQSGLCSLHLLLNVHIMSLPSLLFSNVIDARWALVLPVSWSFWPGILEILFSSIVMYVANKEGTKTSISKMFVLASKSSCNVDTCEHAYLKFVHLWAFLTSWLQTCWCSTLDWRQK